MTTYEQFIRQNKQAQPNNKALKLFVVFLILYAIYSFGYIFIYLTTPTIKKITDNPTQSAPFPILPLSTLGAGASSQPIKAPTKPKTVANPTVMPTTTLPSYYHTPVQPTPAIAPIAPYVDPQIALNAQDREQYRDKCISLSIFQGADYANIKDGNWASCVATQTNAINRAINGGQIFGTRYTEAKKLLAL